MFHLGNLGIPSFNLPRLKLTPLDTDTGTSKFDLTLDIAESPAGLKGWFDYSTDLFDQVTIQRLSERFQILLEAVVADPDTPILSLPLLSAAEENQIVVKLNDTASIFPQAPCLHQIFEQQVEQTPEATAITFEGRNLTYADLNRRSNQLAHRLIKLGVGPEVPVAICMERSLELPIALLAVLKAGGAYVPLEPSYPHERLTFIIEEIHAPVVLTQRAIAENHSLGVHTISLDGDLDDLATESTENPRSEVTEENLCYIIYTSGSTGQPKGAM